MKKKVLLVEFNNWHDECLHTACLFFKSQGCECSLVLNSRLESRVGKDMCGDIPVTYFSFDGFKNLFGSFLQIGRMLRSEGYTHLYLNTAQGSVAWKFFLIMAVPRRIKVVGVIHNVAKLDGSLGQRVITRRMDQYILLSDILVDAYKRRCNKPVSVFYPIDYPLYGDTCIEKPAGELWIGIPGEMSYKRRDYDAIINESAKYGENVKFIFLCNCKKGDGKAIVSRIERFGLADNVILFDSFVDNATFYSYIRLCDYIMPLVHPSKDLYAKYLVEKISGTYNIAFAYRKVMLCPSEMAAYEDFSDTSVFYEEQDLCGFINSLSLIKDTTAFYKLEKWNRGTRYASAVFLE